MATVPRFIVAASIVLLAASLSAQSGGDPSGHWAGAIHVPPFNGAGSREVAIEIDLAKDEKGVLAGTFTQPAQGVKGLPLAAVTSDGRSVSFELKAQSGGRFRGTLTDGTSIAGEFITTEGAYNIPFNLTRTGDARFAAAPTSAPIGDELEGTWNGTIDVNGRKERLVLKMGNRADGRATGTILDLDGSAVEIPIAMTQQASKLTIEVATVGASYAADLTAAHELVGTWTQGSVTLPLTFTRGTK